MRQFRSRLKACRKAYEDALDRIPANPVATNRQSATTRRYAFDLDPQVLSMLLDGAASVVDQQLLDGGEAALWFTEAYVSTAYQRGTGQAFANLAHQSPAYLAGQDSLSAVLRSEPYRRRLALVRARMFEEMKGLSAKVKANMARVLTDGVGRGRNPREIAKDLRRQAGAEQSRANRIARTEVPTALRRARMDEADDAAERYGIRSMQMHISALSPTTRRTHADRHGNLYTTAEQRDWWSRDANSINCKCGVTEVLVDERNRPLVPAIVEKARKTKLTIRRRGLGPWASED